MSEPSSLTIKVPFLLWVMAIRDLRRRGEGRRESGAFLLGKPGNSSAKVTDYICYDALDPNAYQGGIIAFHDTGYSALWDHLKRQQIEVLADVHTHGGPDVRQSSIDSRHPMMPVVGHTAMIAPYFGEYVVVVAEGRRRLRISRKFRVADARTLARAPRQTLALVRII